MLIKNYALQKHKTINNDTLKTESDFKIKDNPTTQNLPFEEKTPQEITILFQEQLTLVKKELDLHKKFNFITRQEYERTLKQYNAYYVYDGYVYNKSDLLSRSIKESNLSRTFIEPPPPFLTPSSTTTTDDETPTESTLEQFVFNPESKSIVGISVQSIRNITGYSYYTTPPWSSTNRPVFIEWQKQMIEDISNILIINGSRQMGKSYWISELLIEESFIPGADILVAAFLQKTTNAILTYMRKFMRDFSEEDFTIYKKDGYIQNNHTWVCIHFRTLWDGWVNVLGLTLRLIVVDEAQLIPVDVFDDVLKPTMTTTGWRLVMIWTAIEDTSSYMFKTISDIAKWQIYNNPWQKTARLITVSADSNPLIHPLERKEIYDNKDSPAIQRQYFNVWWKLSDSLFSPVYIQPQEFYDQHNPSTMTSFLLYGIDPARRADRSGWSLTYVEDGVATTIISGEVPPNLKVDWENQAQFHINQLANLKQSYPHSHIKTVIDLTGLGDWVLVIFRQKGLNIDFKVQYTSGITTSQPLPTTYHVPKSILINNALDFTESKRYKIIELTNKLLQEELKYIQLQETKTWQMWMKSSFYDDISNSVLIALFIAKEMKYVFRKASTLPTQNYNMLTEDAKMYAKNKKPQKQQHSSQYF